MKTLSVIAVSIGTLLFSTLSSVAQTPGPAVGPTGGQTRIQGVPVDDTGLPITPGTQGALINYREEMRLFVQSISAYARGLRPNFVVVANGGLDLLVKRDPVEETKVAPARAYMRALDGVLQEGMFFDVKRGDRAFGTPPVEGRRKSLFDMAAFAQRNGLKVLTLDYGKTKAVVDAAYKQASAKGYISLVSDTPSTDIHRLPTYPSRPFDENATNIASLDKVKNFAVIRNSAPFGRQDAFALKMHDTNYDLIAVEVFHGRRPLSRRAVETLKYKKVGTRRLVFAYMDIGSAASYHYYWQPDWREGSPIWISAPRPDDPDRYSVEFWREEWKQIISGDTNSYTYGLIAQGFDGVIVDGLESYKFFESDNQGDDQNQ